MPDPEIFGDKLRFKPGRACYRMARSKAYLFRASRSAGRCDPPRSSGRHTRRGGASTSQRPCRHPRRAGRPAAMRDESSLHRPQSSSRAARRAVPNGRSMWTGGLVAMPTASCSSYCNTIPTPEGGTHEAGFRARSVKGLRAYGELVGNKKDRHHHRRRCDDRPARCSQRLHPRSGVPGPDQGEAVQPRSLPAGRKRGARPFRPLARRQYGAPRRLLALGRSSADGRAAARRKEKE
jgi:hypothetical protein